MGFIVKFIDEDKNIYSNTICPNDMKQAHLHTMSVRADVEYFSRPYEDITTTSFVLRGTCMFCSYQTLPFR